jgi:hypothetical protein
MHLSQRELLDDFMTFVGESGDTAARAIAARALNRALTVIWMRHPWAIFRSPVPFQLTLVVNQSRYSLPDYFGRVGPGKIRNMTRGGCPLEPRQPGGLDRDYPWYGTTQEQAGLPMTWEIAGMSGVHTQPAVTGDPLEVVSDGVGDTDIVCAIAGDDGNGNWTRNQVTLNGTSAVSIGTWAYVDEFAKAYQASSTPSTDLTSSRGNVTLRKVSGLTELQKLFSQETAREHAILTLYPKPSTADVLAIPVVRRPKRLLHDADSIPDLWEPAVWEEMLIQWAVNKGDISLAAAAGAPRPALIDLIAEDNRTKPTPHTRPYTRGGFRR